jgi:hypothetical protein
MIGHYFLHHMWVGFRSHHKQKDKADRKQGSEHNEEPSHINSMLLERNQTKIAGKKPD